MTAAHSTPYERAYTAQSAYEHLYRMVEQDLCQHVSRHGDQGWRKADPDRLVADITRTLRAGLDPALSNYAVRLAAEYGRELLAHCTCGARPVADESPNTTRMRLDEPRPEVASDAR